MLKLKNGEYDREKAVAYARYWAHGRNPAYYNFDGIGGDCTSFASQCVYAGCGVMNYTPIYGWYYTDINNRAPAWSSVIYLCNFLIGNKDVGPYGRLVGIEEVQKGDLAQLILDGEDYQHTPVITSVGRHPDLSDILVAAHTYDCDNRKLSTYDIKSVRFIHIDGFRHSV